MPTIVKDSSKTKLQPNYDILLRDLQADLDLISSQFEIDSLRNQEMDANKIKRYYLLNKLVYLYHYNREGFIHFGYSETDKLLPGDPANMTSLVKRYFTNKTTKVLELALGHGANSGNLAKEFKYQLHREVATHIY
ncbi:MAG: hypothetical protein BWY68_00760 [bacterium ADurb.Bin400]|nr:MAG: hypothetical protein BWY68_00760 [bacterium ADurb.Bin400]